MAKDKKVEKSTKPRGERIPKEEKPDFTFWVYPQNAGVYLVIKPPKGKAYKLSEGKSPINFMSRMSAIKHLIRVEQLTHLVSQKYRSTDGKLWAEVDPPK